MALADEARKLEQSFGVTHDLLQRLLKSLEQRRAAWVSVRHDVLRPSSEIEQLSKQLALEEDNRTGLLQRIRAAMPSSLGNDAGRLHVNVTRIAAALPPDRGRALRAAADAVQPLARRVRAEVSLGQRLLQFAQRAQSSVEAEFTGIVKATRSSAYDRQARNVQSRGSAGQLVDGRI